MRIGMRRGSASWTRHLRPRMGRLSRYAWKRMLRLQASPHAVAVGVAVGVAISFTPLIGFHLLLAAALAWMLRGNVLAAWIATLVGNPWTFPFMWSASYVVGGILLGRGPQSVGFDMGRVLADPVAALAPVFWPTTLGGLLLGAVIGAAVYYPLCRAIAVHRAHRARKVADARARRLAGAADRRVRKEHADAA